jgi:hypothetical protein
MNTPSDVDPLPKYQSAVFRPSTQYIYFGGQAAHSRRGAADRGEYRQAAGAGLKYGPPIAGQFS